MKWTCDKCGSEKIDQEHCVMLSMNEDDGWEQGIENSYANDFYWCHDCDDDCSPISSEINSLHADFISEGDYLNKYGPSLSEIQGDIDE